jgi:phosphoglycolate phosphatase-like HAD superfamily hydrolase
MLNTLLLFDIDGTLIRESQAIKISYVEAIRSCLGINITNNDLNTSGKTDLLIFKDILERIRIDTAKIDYNDLIREYLSNLEKVIRQDPGIVLPGVKSLLNMLSKQKHMRLALATGNIEKGAKIKLSAHALDSYFEVGGFGTDAIQRSRIVSAGISKAQKHFHTIFQRVVVVGDTTYDIKAAQENNVHSIAVATGPFNPNELRLQQPTIVLQDLTEKDLFSTILDSLPPIYPQKIY